MRFMRFAGGAAALVLIAGASGAVGCGGSGGGGGGGGAPALKAAVYTDTNANGRIDPGDEILVTFTGKVDASVGASASSVFQLEGGVAPRLGTSSLAAGSRPQEVRVVIGAAADFQPNGLHPKDPQATGLNLWDTQGAITHGKKASPVKPRKRPVDVGGALVPRVVSVEYTDVDRDCAIADPDTLRVTFSGPVDILGTPDEAFEALSAGANPLGSIARFVGATTDVTEATIVLGGGATLEVEGTFPLDAGASGLDVTTAPGVVVDHDDPSLDAGQRSVPGVDVGGIAGTRVIAAAYVDDGDGLLGAGDALDVDFCRPVDLGALSTPATAFDLPVAGDDLGAGAAFDPPGGLAGVTRVRIVLGADPVLQANGVFDAPDRVAGAPSGIDVSATGEVTLAGTTTPVDPRADLGVDVAGAHPVGRWTTVPTAMASPRYGHSATLLPNGEILVVGGLTGAPSPTNPAFHETLASLEVFDPDPTSPSYGFRDAGVSLIRPRAYHRAIVTPGVDGAPGTPDDFVVVVGGWNSEIIDNGGPRSEGTIEVILPDPDGDGDVSDIVINPDAAGAPAPVAPFDLGPIDLGGFGPAPGCGVATIGLGIQEAGIGWLPRSTFAGPGDNELIVLGTIASYAWNDCTGTRDLLVLPLGNPQQCEDFRVFFAVDSDNDGDVYEGAPGTPGGVEIGVLYGLYGPLWTTPVSAQRIFNSQTRLAGPDGSPGTADDAFIVYGGFGFDFTEFCVSQQPNICLLGDLEYYDQAAGPFWVGIHGGTQTCGIECTVPGVDPTDRYLHVAVDGGLPGQEVALIGGLSSGNLNQGVPCSQPVEMITPDHASPAFSTMRYGGPGGVPIRGWDHRAAALPRTRGILVTGGADLGRGLTTAASEVVDPARDRVDPAPDMALPRESHAVVVIPAGFAGSTIAEDRIYVIGGVERSPVFPGLPAGAARVTDTVEFFAE